MRKVPAQPPARPPCRAAAAAHELRDHAVEGGALEVQRLAHLADALLAWVTEQRRRQLPRGARGRRDAPRWRERARRAHRCTARGSSPRSSGGAAARVSRVCIPAILAAGPPRRWRAAAAREPRRTFGTTSARSSISMRLRARAGVSVQRAWSLQQVEYGRPRRPPAAPRTRTAGRRWRCRRRRWGSAFLQRWRRGDEGNTDGRCHVSTLAGRPNQRAMQRVRHARVWAAGVARACGGAGAGHAIPLHIAAAARVPAAPSSPRRPRRRASRRP